METMRTRRLLGGGEALGNGAILVGSVPTGDGRGWIVPGRQLGCGDVGSASAPAAPYGVPDGLTRAVTASEWRGQYPGTARYRLEHG
jgi:hypothetical protein